MSGGADPGSPDPFEAFYRRAWPDAVRWATALTGSVAAGEDVAQDAFARVRSRFRSIDNVDGYLRATIVNLARDARRSSERRAARELRVVGDLEAAEAAVRQYYGDALCVVPAQHSKDELVAIENQLMSMSSVQFMWSALYADATGEWLELGTITPEPDRQAAFDEQYGAGVVRLSSGMRPL